MPTAAPESDLKVFITNRDASCGECGAKLGPHAWITLQGNGVLCMACADLDHLVYLPAGNTALTRRTRKLSRLSAVVLKWSRARKRYERQGLLVEEAALQAAEEECAADETERAAARARAAMRREELDEAYVLAFAQRVRELFPACPAGRDAAIAQHACRKYSGRVGRSAAAKDLAAKAVRLAVAAAVRHTETPYDELLSRGVARDEARQAVRARADAVLAVWARGR